MRKNFLLSAVAAAVIGLFGIGTSIAAPITSGSKVTNYSDDTTVSGLMSCLNFNGKAARKGDVIRQRGYDNTTIIRLASSANGVTISSVKTVWDNGVVDRHRVAEWLEDTERFCWKPDDTRSLSEKLTDAFNR